MIGDFPINDGRNILGEFVESFLDDFNLTTVSVDTHGGIDIRSNKYNFPETSDNHFHIIIDTDKNGSWNGINFTSFKGTILKETNSLLFDFPTIQTCNGNISLIIDSNLTNKNSIINLKASNLKVNELFDSINSYQLKTDKILSGTNATKEMAAPVAAATAVALSATVFNKGQAAPPAQPGQVSLQRRQVTDTTGWMINISRHSRLKVEHESP